MNKFVSLLAALALLGCVSAQTFGAFTPGGLASLALLPPLINQLAMPVRPPPPPPAFYGGFGYLPPTIIERRVRSRYVTKVDMDNIWTRQTCANMMDILGAIKYTQIKKQIGCTCL
ncbi:hypothetical protein KP79_PYT02823 [Mizuhopecten yessoensis]|uniref:Uncharacterized protein n=1 Tax=Mizuhopecten yessoensis TaxID=6573 RepID=A0A210PJZ0_MIZYE|nr:hypothetical protein KP79_PYT02823 [Mizuhopecten yessoensis]